MGLCCLDLAYRILKDLLIYLFGAHRVLIMLIITPDLFVSLCILIFSPHFTKRMGCL